MAWAELSALFLKQMWVAWLLVIHKRCLGPFLCSPASGLDSQFVWDKLCPIKVQCCFSPSEKAELPNLVDNLNVEQTASLLLTPT